MDKSIESFESFESLLCRVYELCWSCSQKLRLGSTTHLEISEAHLRSVSHFLGLRKILPPPSTNAAIPQVRVEEKIKSLGFCSDISHFLPLILTRKKSSITRVLIFNGLAWKQPQLSFELLRACLLCRVSELFSGGLRKKSNLLDFAQPYLIFCPWSWLEKKTPSLGYLFSLVWPGNNLNWVLDLVRIRTAARLTGEHWEPAV